MKTVILLWRKSQGNRQYLGQNYIASITPKGYQRNAKQMQAMWSMGQRREGDVSHKAKNADLWIVVNESLTEGMQVKAEKVTSHCTVRQVARGEVSFEDYAGNGIADVLAKVATRVATVDREAGDHAGKMKALAFMMAIRIAIIEVKVDRFLEQEQLEWEIKMAPKPKLVNQEAVGKSNKLKQNGHQLVQVGENKTRCTRCHKTATSRQFNFWLKYECASSEEGEEKRTALKPVKTITQKHVKGATEWQGHRLASDGGKLHCVLCGKVGPSVATFDGSCEGLDAEETGEEVEEVRRMRGTMKEAFKEKEEQRQKEKMAAAISRINSEVASAILLSGILSTSKEESKQPKWASRVDRSHEAWHGGGMVFCRNCGFVAGGVRSKLGLVSPCRWSTQGLGVPQGSKHRLAKMKIGRCPEAGTKHWPDGTDVNQRVRMRRVVFDEGPQSQEASTEHKEAEQGDRSEEECLEEAAAWNRSRREAKEEAIKASIERVGENAIEELAGLVYIAAEKGASDGKWAPQELEDFRMGALTKSEVITHIVRQPEWENKADMWLEKTAEIENLFADLIESLELRGREKELEEENAPG